MTEKNISALTIEGERNISYAREYLRQFEQTHEVIYLDLTHYYLFRLRECELPVRGEPTDDEMQA